MSLDDALFLVYRNNTTYHVKGIDISTKIRSGDRILVQRGDDVFHSWCGQQDFTQPPLFSYKFYYEVGIGNGPPGGDGSPTNGHPTGDGKINLSLYFSNGGPYPTNEWRNVRNTQNTINDLDGKQFRLLQNPDIENGDIVRITELGGNFEGFYSIKKDTNGFLMFETQYTRDDGRPRTDIKRSTNKRPAYNSNVVLRFDIFRNRDLPFNIRNNDLLLAYDEQGNVRHVTGYSFKQLFIQPRVNVLSRPVIEYDGRTDSNGSVRYNKVSNAVLSRPPDKSLYQWCYFKDNTTWWKRLDEYGYYYIENVSTKVKYEEAHHYGDIIIYIESDVLPFGPP